jgi:hypothetical protein
MTCTPPGRPKRSMARTPDLSNRGAIHLVVPRDQHTTHRRFVANRKPDTTSTGLTSHYQCGTMHTNTDTASMCTVHNVQANTYTALHVHPLLDKACFLQGEWLANCTKYLFSQSLPHLPQFSQGMPQALCPRQTRTGKTATNSLELERH